MNIEKIKNRPTDERDFSMVLIEKNENWKIKISGTDKIQKRTNGQERFDSVTTLKKKN